METKFARQDVEDLPEARGLLGSVAVRFMSDPSNTIQRILEKTRMTVSGEQQAAEQEAAAIIRSISDMHDDKIDVIQIGANDGLHNDPIQQFRNLPWRLTLVEPNPHAFESLCRTYESRAETQLIEAAITSANGEAVLHALPFATGNEVENPLQGKDSLDPSHADKHAHLVKTDGQNLVTPITVEAMTVDKLIATCGTEPTGYFIDTEGHDQVVVEQILSRDGELPGFIFFESVHIPDQERLELNGDLLLAGYEILELDNDTLAYSA